MRNKPIGVIDKKPRQIQAMKMGINWLRCPYNTTKNPRTRCERMIKVLVTPDRYAKHKASGRPYVVEKRCQDNHLFIVVLKP